MTKIVFVEMEVWEEPYLQKQLHSKDLFFSEDILSAELVEKVSDAEILSVFIYSKVTREMLDALPKLKLIVTRSTGFDHIDVEACREKNIVVCNVPTYGENTVAEHTFALLLNLTRKIHKAWDRTRRLDFSQEGLRGTDLQGKTIGVVGVGSIGEHIIRIAKGFEMNVIAFDPNKQEELARQLDFSYVEFDELLEKADVITLHCPYNKKTHHLINKDNITKIKQGAFLINTARGGLIETDALVHALKEGQLGGAGLDVLEEECNVLEDAQVMSKNYPQKCDMHIILENHILAKMDNVIITPHNAFNSTEAIERILDTTVKNIHSFEENKIINQVK